MYSIKFKDLIKKNLAPSQQWILTDSHPILRAKVQEVDNFEFSKEDVYYLKHMVNYIEACFNEKHKKYKIRKGVAVAAPQVGWNKRVVYIHFEDDREYHYLLINPKITSKSDTKAFLVTGEGCLSVNPDREGYVVRSEIVSIEAYDLVSESHIKETFSGFASMCIQHELDHLDGILYYDYINKDDKFKKDPTWVAIGE